MDIRQLRYFVAIVEQGSFSRAATFLHIAQPALSLHVRNMEADLGTPLLFRSTRGVVPTEAGAILLRNARIILDQLAIAEDEIRGHHSDPSGEVRLGLPGTIGQILAVPLITAARLRYPRIRLRIAEAMSGFVLEWMRDARIDIAVLYDALDDQGIRTQPLLEEELLLFGPAHDDPAYEDLGQKLPAPGSPVPFAQVARMPLILPGEGHGLRDLLARSALAAGCELNTVIDIDSYGNIKELVAEGLGFSVLPENAIEREVAQARLHSWTICDKPVRRSVHLAHSVDRPMANAVRVVLDLAGEILRDLARTGRWAGAKPVAGADAAEPPAH